VFNGGVLIGYPMVDCKVTLHDGAFHETDSSPKDFEIAACAAMKEGCTQGGVHIMEPIMELEVVTPFEFVRAIISDLNRSRADTRSTFKRDDNTTVIKASVPLASLLGYVARLRTLSDGRATHHSAFSHYQEVPKNIMPDPDSFPPAIGMRA
jgi:elongation factor G